MKIPVQCVGLSIERDRLIKQLVVGRSLHLQDKVIPGVVVRIAGDPGRNPMGISIVPNVPLIAASYTTFVSPDEPHAVEKLIEVKLQSLGRTKVVSPEVNVV